MPDLFVPTAGFLFGSPGWQELLLIALIGLLIFGKRLPEVGKSLGKGIVEFKKGLAGVQEDVEQAGDPKRLERDATATQDAAASKERQTTSAP